MGWEAKKLNVNAKTLKFQRYVHCTCDFCCLRWILCKERHAFEHGMLKVLVQVLVGVNRIGN